MTNFSHNPQTQKFVSWLSARIDGTAEVNFVHTATGHSFSTLQDAHDAYEWPPKRKTISTPDGDLELRAGATLAENQQILDRLSQRLRECLDDPVSNEALLARWIQAILIWGGVYTRHKNGGGNAGWLDTRLAAQDLTDNLRTALAALQNGTIHFHDGPSSLRSNAGLTKVYSLVLDNFVIYDSRVAAALAWLVTSWARETGSRIPDHLKFACMRANEGSTKNKAPGSTKVRSPDPRIFPYFAPSQQLRDHRRHAVWNQRANHVLACALKEAHARQDGAVASDFRTVRDVEAALFVMGADLRYALVFSTNP